MGSEVGAGGTWSDRGLALVRLAALFDWLYEDLDEATRRETIQKIERAADADVAPGPRRLRPPSVRPLDHPRE